ncbi:MAG: HAMP domain-containing histidine kinase [Limnobacter sp.]|nr:HAMP domain-containing histidine kinase [Limnobacter sp.]
MLEYSQISAFACVIVALSVGKNLHRSSTSGLLVNYGLRAISAGLACLVLLYQDPIPLAMFSIGLLFVLGLLLNVQRNAFGPIGLACTWASLATFVLGFAVSTVGPTLLEGVSQTQAAETAILLNLAGLLASLLPTVLQIFFSARIQSKALPYEPQKMLCALMEIQRSVKACSHDLRQPLSTIGIVGGVGKAICQDEQIRQRFEHILLSQKSLKDMLDSLFDNLTRLSKPGIDHLENHKMQAVTGSELLDHLEEDFTYLAKAKGLDLILSGSTPEFHTLPDFLYQILRNGLDNAIKYTKNGSVFVRTYPNDSEFVFEILDTGTGIENESVPNKDKGWGYGSQIASTLAERLDAKLVVRNRTDGTNGTLFRLSLPSMLEKGRSVAELPSLGPAPELVLLGPMNDTKSLLMQLDCVKKKNLRVLNKTTKYCAIWAASQTLAPTFFLSVVSTREELLVLEKLSRSYSKSVGRPPMIIAGLLPEAWACHRQFNKVPGLTLLPARLEGGKLTIDFLADIVGADKDQHHPQADATRYRRHQSQATNPEKNPGHLIG